MLVVCACEGVVRVTTAWEEMARRPRPGRLTGDEVVGMTSVSQPAPMSGQRRKNSEISDGFNNEL